MKNGNWKYKVSADPFSFIPTAILLIVFCGLFLLLYFNNNGAFLLAAPLAMISVVIALAGVYRYLFVKILVNETGFYFQTNPGNGKYYAYADITEAWGSSGKTTSGMVNSYFNFKTADGKTIKFNLVNFEIDGIEYILEQVNGSCEDDSEEDFYEE